MRLSVSHDTRYRFERPQQRLIQMARLTPSGSAGQTVIDWNVEVDCDARLRAARDGYGNELTMLYIDGPREEVTISVSGEVLTEDTGGVIQGANERLPPLVFLRESELTRCDAAIEALASEARDAGSTTLDRMHALMRILYERLHFDTDRMDVKRTAAAALARGHGVCQDFTHIFAAAARAIDVPARYVSGHLFRRDGLSEQTAAHAWAEAYVEGLGWVGFDTANGIAPDDAYVRVAVGLDYREAAPLVGARIGGGDEALDVAISVVQAGRQSQS